MSNLEKKVGKLNWVDLSLPLFLLKGGSMCVDEKRCNERMENLGKDISGLDQRVTKLENTHFDLNINMVRMANRMGTLESDMKDLKSDIRKILDKPGKYWETVVFTVIGAIIGYLVNSLL